MTKVVKMFVLSFCMKNIIKTKVILWVLFLGAPFSPFTRLIAPDYEDGVGLPRGGNGWSNWLFNGKNAAFIDLKLDPENLYKITKWPTI